MCRSDAFGELLCPPGSSDGKAPTWAHEAQKEIRQKLGRPELQSPRHGRETPKDCGRQIECSNKATALAAAAAECTRDILSKDDDHSDSGQGEGIAKSHDVQAQAEERGDQRGISPETERLHGAIAAGSEQPQNGTHK